MKKKFGAVLLLAVLCIGMALGVGAANTTAFINKNLRLNDNAGLLSDSEQKALLSRLDEISERQNMDIIIVTLPNLHNYSAATPLADDIFDDCGYGYGEGRDGILFLISMQDRDWAISTHGKGITAFTDAGQEYIIDRIRDDLADDNFADAFDTFVTLCDDFISQVENGEPYDWDNLPRAPLSVGQILICVAISFIIARIAVRCMKGQLKTVRRQAAANSYVKEDSLDITESSDLFLYQTVSRVEKPKDDDSSHGGGSSTHTSSSGSTHGGSSGKF